MIFIKNITLAVVIPVYDGEKYIEQSIYSVLNQPCKDLNIIVVNDGSTDNTKKILDKIKESDNRVIILNQTNRGVSAARNNALDYCSSVINPKYIAFLDSDDVWLKDFYTEDLKNLLLENNKELYKFEYIFGDQNLRRGKLQKINEENGVLVIYDDAHFCSYIYSNEVLKRFNIRFFENAKYEEDNTFKFIFYSLCKNSKCIKKLIFVYRSNINSAVHGKFDPFDKFINNNVLAWGRVMETLDGKKDQEDSIRYCKIKIKKYIIDYIVNAYGQGCKTKDIKNNLEFCKYNNYLYDDKIWLDDWRKRIFNEFLKSPGKLHLKLRIKHILLSCARKFRNVKIIVNMRYPIDISEMI